MRQKIIRFLSIMIGILSVMVVVLGGYAYTVYSGAWANPANVLVPNSNSTKAPSTMLVTTQDPSGNINEDVLHYNHDVVNLVIVGVDNSVTRLGYQADVIIICAINHKTNQVEMITVPRDTYATVNKIDSKGKITGTTKFKINSSFNYGGGKDGHGYENVLMSLERLFGIEFNYYVGLDMDGVGPVSTKVGGVPVTVSADFSRWGMPKGSKQLLKGDKALTYIRERKVPGETGSDIGRTERQKEFIKSFARVVQQKGAVQMATMLYNEANKYLDTNMTLDEILAFASILKDTKVDDIPFKTIPGEFEYIGSYDCYILDDKKFKALVQEVYFGS